MDRNLTQAAIELGTFGGRQRALRSFDWKVNARERVRREVSAQGGTGVVDLPERHHASYLACLEDWSSEMAEAGDHKATWYGKMKDEGLRVKRRGNRFGPEKLSHMDSSLAWASWSENQPVQPHVVGRRR